MNEQTSKNDAPYLANPVVAWLGLLGSVWVFTDTILRQWQSGIEPFTVVISLLSGFMFGNVGAWVVTAILWNLATRAHTEPAAKWMSLCWLLMGARGVLGIAGLIATLAAGAGATLILANRAGSVTGDSTNGLNMALYMYLSAFVIVIWARILWWYYRLPR